MAKFTLSEAIVSIKSVGLDKLKMDLDKLDTRLKRLGAGTSAKGLTADFRNTTRATNELGASVGRVGNLLAVMPSRGTAAMSTFTGSLGTATTAMSGLGVAAVGATTAVAAIVGAGAGLVKSVKVAADLESRLAEVATISTDVAKNIRGFTNEIGRLSIATRTDSGLLAEGFYQSISAGITNTSEALKVVETSANAARAGLTSVDVAVDGLTSALNAYGIEASKVDRVSDAFFKTVETGKLRFEDIASGIGSVAPLASQLGISLNELLAAGSALTLTGQSLSESFTNIQGVMNAVLRPTAEAENLAEELGLEFSATALQTKGLIRFLKDLEIQTGGDIEVMGQLFGRIEGLRGVLALTGNQAEAFESNLRAIENSAGATQKAVAIQNQTFQAQVDLLKNQLNFAMQTIGEEALPAVTEAVKDLTLALDGVDWDKFRKNAETAIGGLTDFIRGFANSVRGTIDLIDLLVIPGGGVPDSIKRGARGFGRGVQSSASNIFLGTRPPNFLDDTFFGTRTGGRRVALPSVPTQPRIPTAASVATTPQPTGATRAIRLTPEQQELAAQALGVSPDFIAAPSARQARGFRTARTGGFVAPTAGTGIAPTTRTPIPGVQGELVSPALNINQTVADSVGQVVMGIATELTKSENISTIADTFDVLREPLTDAGRLSQESRDLLSQAALDRSRQFQGAVPTAFGTPQAMPGQNITPLIREEGERLAEGFGLVSAALEGGAHGGIAGALIAVGGELLSMTEGFSRIQEAWNMLVERLVTALEPIVTVAADLLVPVFSALGNVLDALNPLFQAISQVIKIYLQPAFTLLGKLLNGLATGIRHVINFFTRIINFVIDLINRIPFVNIQRIGERNAPGVPGEQQAIGAEQGRLDNNLRGGRASSGGLRISAITGASRDILVDALRPLRQLNTTFPAMLDELQHIRAALTGGETFDVAAPATAGVGGGGISINELHINVEQVADLGEVEDLRQRLAEAADFQNRAEGGVFPQNR